jgi:hypothetical protein
VGPAGWWPSSFLPRLITFTPTSRQFTSSSSKLKHVSVEPSSTVSGKRQRHVPPPSPPPHSVDITLIDRHQLVSSKYLTAFSDFRFPAYAPDFVSPEEYVQYLLDYAKHFKILSHIRYRTIVSRVRRRQGGGHVVTTLNRDTLASTQHQCDAVVVCSGLHLTPVIPTDIQNLFPSKPTTAIHSSSNPNWAIPDQGTPSSDESSWMNTIFAQNSPLPGAASLHAFRTLHSSTFKNHPGPLNEFLPRSTPRPSSSSDSLSSDSKAAQEHGSTVVVLGAGETAHDIAASAINHPSVARVILSHRNGFFVAPKVTPEPVILRFWGRPYPGKRRNKPLDTTIASLFDTAYVPAPLQRGGLLWAYYRWWVRCIFWAIGGTGDGFDQWVGGVKGRGIDSRGFYLWAFSAKGGRY